MVGVFSALSEYNELIIIIELDKAEILQKVKIKVKMRLIFFFQFSSDFFKTLLAGDIDLLAMFLYGSKHKIEGIHSISFIVSSYLGVNSESKAMKMLPNCNQFYCIYLLVNVEKI